jgi:zinc transport system substrate-binding protein
MQSRWAIGLIIAATCLACNGGGAVDQEPTPIAETATLVVYTVNYPLAYFAKRIGGDLVEVALPVPADVDPAYWTPEADVIERYQRADLIILNGAGFANWVNYSTLPMSKVVDTSVSFTDRWIELEDTVTHSHGPEGEHAHRGWAFTTWLDPTLAAEQARAIARALIGERPDEESAIRDRLALLEIDLQALDGRMAAASEIIGDETLIVSHPVYQYLVARYGLEAIELHWEADEVPGTDAWATLDAMLEEQPARWMLWEGQPEAATATGLEQRGITSLVFEPCGNVPSSGDFLTVMQANAASLEAVADALSSEADAQSPQLTPSPTERPAAGTASSSAEGR